MPQTLEEFLRRGQAAQAAVDRELAKPPTVDPGRWIHMGCGGELTRLQGINRPVCTSCGKTVIR